MVWLQEVFIWSTYGDTFFYSCHNSLDTIVVRSHGYVFIHLILWESTFQHFHFIKPIFLVIMQKPIIYTETCLFSCNIYYFKHLKHHKFMTHHGETYEQPKGIYKEYIDTFTRNLCKKHMFRERTRHQGLYVRAFLLNSYFSCSFSYKFINGDSFCKYEQLNTLFLGLMLWSWLISVH